MAVLAVSLVLTGATAADSWAPTDQAPCPDTGIASWYGEAHRGKLMANGQPFNPDAKTAASWFYPMGTRVRVTKQAQTGRHESVTVTITDRGPARQHVRKGRIIDLALGAFKELADPGAGLIQVRVEAVEENASEAVDRPPTVRSVSTREELP